jgi:hypothetical protein
MNVCKHLSGWEKCLALIAHGSDALHEENLASAEASLQLALRLAQSTPPEQAHGLLALALCNRDWEEVWADGLDFRVVHRARCYGLYPHFSSMGFTSPKLRL